MTPKHTPACFAHHMGLYLIEPRWFQSAQAMLRMTPDHVMHAFNPREAYEQYLNAEPIVERTDFYGITASGIATIPVVGVMTKGSSKFGTSTIDVRRALNQAVNDPKVNAIMLHFDTPGGGFAGLDDLAADIRKAGAQKPLHAHADDLVASAGMYAASQAARLTINPSGEAGSIGTYAIIEDSSGAAELAGIKVHLFSTGEMKGMGAPGVPLTDPQISRMQEMVNNAQQFFSKALMEGRGLDNKQVADLVADGGVYFAAEAKKRGLVDGVESYSEALDRLASRIGGRKSVTPRRNIASAKATVLALRGSQKNIANTLDTP